MTCKCYEHMNSIRANSSSEQSCERVSLNEMKNTFAKTFLCFVLICRGAFLCHAVEKDPLQRDVLDPFVKLSGLPTLPPNDPKETLRFEKWDPIYTKYLDQALIYLPDWRERLLIPDPPANTSERTRAELDYM